jgi:uncharacterized membrane protein YoaK (UPF0700 family)
MTEVRDADRTTDRGLTVVLLGLTAATGLIDAVCYLGMGHVLVANMTGNVVFLGFALAGAKGLSIAAFLVALGSFLFGAALGGRLAVSLRAHRRRWLVVASGAQLTLAAIAALATASGVMGPSGPARFGLIALLGTGTGIQNATMRRLAIPDLTTTVLTMTLTGLASDSSLSGGRHVLRSRRIASPLAMLAGAAVGGAVMTQVGFAATLLLLTAVLAAVTVGFARWAPAPTLATSAPYPMSRTEGTVMQNGNRA